jgi:hypothetical protein
MELISEMVEKTGAAEEREVHRLAQRLNDRCAICGERLAHRTCEVCERRICNVCAIVSALLTFSHFCSSECRDEAELAAEQVRQTDSYGRWR